MRIAVFCGSASRVAAPYVQAARAFGDRLARRGHGLVYGGGGTGLMGEVAEAVLAAGGPVLGVMPEFMVRREAALHSLPDLRIVATMAERKALMTAEAEAFVALPGGIGTLEELFEVWSGHSLDHHRKPMVLLNTDGFYDELLRFLDRAAADHFVRAPQRAALAVAGSPDQALDLLEAARPA